MTQLYLVFLIAGLVLFSIIVAYSVWRSRQLSSQEIGDKSEPDPLFEVANQPKPSRVNEAVRQAVSARQETSEDDDAKEYVDQTSDEDDDTKSELTPSVAKQETDSLEPAVKTSAKSSISSGAKTESKKTAQVQRKPSELVTELVARMKNTQPLEQRELLAVFREFDYKFNRKVHIYGLNELTDMWRDVEHELPSARFVSLGISIQLADRNGHVASKELHDFQQMVLAFAEKFDIPFEFSMDVDEAKEHGAQLDEITKRFDVMAVLNIVPRSKAGFRSADIESCARDLLMVKDTHGIFVKAKGQKQNLTVKYRLACPSGSGNFGIKSGAMSPIHDLVVYMNVPAVKEPDLVFLDMVEDAKKLATWLDGKVVDRQGKVMTQRSYEKLMKQVSDVVYDMQREGIVPGDALSKKLF